MISDSCLCWQLKYHIDSPIHLINNYHCSMCMKAHGAAFGCFLHANADGIQ